jgi:hypothetical protein
MELDVKRAFWANALHLDSPEDGVEHYKHGVFALRHDRVDNVRAGIDSAVKTGADYFYIEDRLFTAVEGRTLRSDVQNVVQGHLGADHVATRDKLMEEVRAKIRKIPLQSVALMFEKAVEKPTPLHDLLKVLEKEPAENRYAVFTTKDEAGMRAVRIREKEEVLDRLGARLWPLPAPAPEGSSPGAPSSP